MAELFAAPEPLERVPDGRIDRVAQLESLLPGRRRHLGGRVRRRQPIDVLARAHRLHPSALRHMPQNRVRRDHRYLAIVLLPVRQPLDYRIRRFGAGTTRPARRPALAGPRDRAGQVAAGYASPARAPGGTGPPRAAAVHPQPASRPLSAALALPRSTLRRRGRRRRHISRVGAAGAKAGDRCAALLERGEVTGAGASAEIANAILAPREDGVGRGRRARRERCDDASTCQHSRHCCASEFHTVTSEPVAQNAQSFSINLSLRGLFLTAPAATSPRPPAAQRSVHR